MNADHGATKAGAHTEGAREALRLDELETPLGTVVLLVDAADRLRLCGFATGHDRMIDALRLDAPAPRREADPGGVTSALRAYFAGELSAIERIAVHAAGGTAFQLRVWSALREIPCGTTWSYGQLAARIGRPKAVRAVGFANGRNPVGIVVPCHRVIGADGTLTGYGGGVERKRWLLAHERALLVA